MKGHVPAGADVRRPGRPREAAGFEAGSARGRSGQPQAPLPSFLCPPPRAQRAARNHPPQPLPWPRCSQHSCPPVGEVHLQTLRTDTQASDPPAPSPPPSLEEEGGTPAVQPLPGPLAQHCSPFSTAPTPPGHSHCHCLGASLPHPLLRIHSHLHPPLRRGPPRTPHRGQFPS